MFSKPGIVHAAHQFVLRGIDLSRLVGTRQHHLPHIHAMYAGDEAVFAIETADLLDGGLPRRETRLVQAWID